MISKTDFKGDSLKRGSDFLSGYKTNLGNSVEPDEILYPAFLRKLNKNEIKRPEDIILSEELVEFFNFEYEMIVIKESEFNNYSVVSTGLLQHTDTLPIVEQVTD